MPSVLGVNFMGNWVLAVEVKTNGRRPKVTATHAAKLPKELTPSHAEELGNWFKGELKTHGFSASDAVCAVGRNLVSLRSVKVPQCPDAELPAIVRFALEGESQSPLDEHLLDFQQPTSVGDEREVLTATIASSAAAAIGSMLQSAGLHLKRLSLRAFGAQYTCAQGNLDGLQGWNLLLSLGVEANDLSLWNGRELVLSRSMPVNGDDAATRVIADVRRTLGAFHSQYPAAKIDRILTCGKRSEEIARAVENATGETTVPLVIDEILALEAVPQASRDAEFANLAEGGEVLATAGCAWREAVGSEWPMDFLSPKKVVVARDHRKSSALLGGALAALVLVGLVYYTRSLFAERDRRISLYANELTQLNQELSSLKSTIDRHKVIKDWVDGDANWLVELTAVSAAFPTTEQAYLTGLELYAGRTGKPGSIKLEGRAKGQNIVTTSQKNWAKHNRYLVAPRGIDPAADTPEFPWRFGLDLNVRPLPTKAIVEQSVEWTKLATEEPPGGKVRVEAGLGTKGLVAGSKVTGTPSAGSGSSVSKSEIKDAKRAIKEEKKSGSSPSAEESSGDPVARLVEKLKAMPIDQREAEIAKAPKFLQARIRKMLKEAKP
ncbi:MAG: hypothetical protein U1D30_01920 [Planctomycetota bacterium]